MEIEDLHRVVVQGFASLNDKIDSVDAKVDRLDAKVDRLDAKVDRLDARVDRLDARVDGLDAKVDGGLAAVNQRIDNLIVHMDTEFGRVKDAIMEHGRQLKDIHSALDRKVDRDELVARH